MKFQFEKHMKSEHSIALTVLHDCNKCNRQCFSAGSFDDIKNTQECKFSTSAISVAVNTGQRSEYDLPYHEKKNAKRE